ncbi:hypothetical protein IE81DRAFT_322126 [Ceraceosorus guamensis]|uniref:DUF7053 domain-containing protein n=1 Tax=Ceraceosorus guamensis TaxID=1522189 RepID=A0A316W1D9_9BASI|nr:hypothetical protein IE81DRAFT_322126 [Ceraceosorus guamensis]PWN43717.1 hypothetical protein IE81DRAFT_322126 [Ceraceosorus guamensis]
MVVFRWEHSEEIEVQFDKVIQFLHDPPTMLNTASHMVEVRQDPNDASLYHITERLNAFSTVKFSAHFEYRDDGMTSRWNAPMNVNAESQWIVKRVDSDKPGAAPRSLLREVARVHVPFLFYHYVKHKYVKIHSRLPKLFEAAIVERDEQSQPSGPAQTQIQAQDSVVTGSALKAPVQDGTYQADVNAPGTGAGLDSQQT